MNNLSEAGINLRTLKPGLSYDDLIQDLNYNFVQFLHSPGFKGMPGQSIVGPPGSATRGSKWIFINEQQFKSVYPSIQDSSQITLMFINSEFVNNAAKFYSSIYIPNDTELIIGDTIVLPSGEIIELITLNGTVQFVNTNITFSQVSSITEQEVIDLILYYLSTLTPNQSGFVYFDAEAKNANDTQPSLNTNQTNGSVVDLNVSNSGPGYPLVNYKIIAPSETKVDEASKLMLLTGSVKKYHNLIQLTQTGLTNAYAPQVNTLPALTILQNNYSNGILFGYQDATSFKDFSRLYRSSVGAVLTSSFSPNPNEFSEILLTNSSFTVRTPEVNLNATKLNFSGTKIKSAAINANASTIKIGGNPLLDQSTEFENYTASSTEKLILSASESMFFRVKNLANSTIISVDANNKVTSTYQIKQAINNSAYEVPSSAAIYAAHVGFNNNFASISGSITLLSNHYFGERLFIETNVDLNSLIKFGTFGIKKSVTVANLPEILPGPGTSTNPTGTIVSEDLILNVYRVQKTAFTYSIVQELFYSYPYNYSPTSIVDRRYVKFVRTGKLTVLDANGSLLDTVQWGIWNRQLDTLDTFSSENNGITVTGSFHTNDLKIKHKLKVTTLLDQLNVYADTKVLKSQSYDEYGHVISTESYDIHDHFVKKTDYDFDQMVADIAQLKIYAAPFYAGGGMVLWKKPFNEIPTGWKEVVEWRKRMPFGYDPNDTDFNQVGKEGGNKTIVQTTAQMPKHSHMMPYQTTIQTGGRQANDAFHRVDSAYTSRYTNETGGNEAMNIMNPFRIVVFIEPA